eukprot:1366570-Pyramimonas_sp.AAC.2
MSVLGAIGDVFTLSTLGNLRFLRRNRPGDELPINSTIKRAGENASKKTKILRLPIAGILCPEPVLRGG